MCGIIGFNWEDKKLLKKMMDSISYRGPNDLGVFSDKTISLGHQRLSIIDLSKSGRQPMSNEDGKVLVVFNGEIYNFKQIKNELTKKGHRFKSNTDTEIIVHLYEEVGKNFVKYLDGDFAIFLYDSKAKKGFLARDRMGVKPLYYFVEQQNFVFASELKAILQCERIKKEIDSSALSDYLIYGYVPLSRTIIKNVKKVLPSEIIEIDLRKNSLIKDIYFEINKEEKIQSYSQAKEELIALLKSSVKDQMMADVPVGAYLSGGIDSSTIVSFISENLSSSDKLKTYSVGFDSEDVENELKFAKLVSEKYNTDHKEILVSIDSIKNIKKIMYHLDEPISNLASIPYYYLSKEASKKVKVVLSGTGGDEIFGGYRDYRIANFAQKTKYLGKIIPFGVLEKISTKNKRKYFSYLNKVYGSSDLYELFKNVQNKNFSDEERKLIYEKFEDSKKLEEFSLGNHSTLKKFQLTNLRSLIPDNFLVLEDRMSMANSIEARVPMLNYKLVNFGISLPDRYKFSDKGKKILRDVAKNRLPEANIVRKKYGFTAPLKYWFNDYLKEDMKDRLSKSNLFDRKETLKKFENPDNHKINQLWQLYGAQLWHDIFIDNEKIKTI